ncbi:leucine-rich repeat domain-containing protein [Halosquirtibacter laminarini]|uniref:Leucine-rich repeat domain-containing protein n=1 Tax=Halosquirtibacter laminarini TaxID=3374600 RepID=A0AC61NM72_9BACT|nr:leucine-rich repeat domain-containing protein [Prolixibacteraceae bacterium]
MKRILLLGGMMFCSLLGWTKDDIKRIKLGDWEYHMVELNGVEGASLDLYVGTDTKLEILDEIDGHHVISLCHDGNVSAGLFGQNFYNENHRIQTVSTLNATYLKEIGPCTFQFCENDRFSVHLNEDIEYIRENDFSNSSIREIEFPTSLKSLGDFCYEYCKNLQYLYRSSLPERVTKIPFSVSVRLLTYMKIDLFYYKDYFQFRGSKSSYFDGLVSDIRFKISVYHA